MRFVLSFQKRKFFLDSLIHVTCFCNYQVYNQIIVMFLHQALPKDAQVTRKPTYEIRRRFSPKVREKAVKNENQSKSNSNFKIDSLQKTNPHLIASKQKPAVASKEKISRSPLPKQISVFSIKKVSPPNEPNSKSVDRQQTMANQNQTPERQTIERKQACQPEKKSETIFCKIENKIVKSIDCSFLYSDLSTIEEIYCLRYEGQTIGNRIRHGFGTQTYTNGQKFIGQFSENQAHGQGTYYGLKRKIMGFWENNRLRQIILQL